MLQKLLYALCGMHMKKQIIFQLDNTCPHTAHLTSVKTEMFGLDVLSHSPYILDLSFLDCNLFGPLEDHMRNQQNENDEAIQQIQCTWLRNTEKACAAVVQYW
jgi:hypothetical protein